VPLVAISTISFLTIVSFNVAVSSRFNSLGGDVWLLRLLRCSFCFCFFSLVEFCACNYLLRLENLVKSAHEKADADLRAQTDAIAQVADVELVSNGAGAAGAAMTTTSTSSRTSTSATTEAACHVGAPGAQTLHPTEHATPTEVWCREIRQRRYALPPEQLALRRREAKLALGRRAIFLNRRGELRIYDQTLDIACRYLYPVAYAITLGVFYRGLD
jgi:hypothetical protein